ncbi:hypothetical protein [Streptomyces antarcticus]|uniref:hypothetical protein n=1 Tax=Streptomyces antarcticus TaxID=2996458 RepID=UPI00227049E4|nr:MULTISPECIES: hypothetical protein [unclassified Streptomyces]MCY0943519.1 hypothetical protein [Streptomyces sp. H34-AA3]MCZ4083572.1 hypothetical protein [Streptomyces sp. H34-S5]
MITTEFKLTPTDVTTCEACWRAPVEAARVGRGARDLLCLGCAETNAAPRVVLFPPLGVYGLSTKRIEMGKHAGGPPKLPPNPGPALPTPPPTPTTGRPPV